MALKDLLKTAPTPANARPPGITCEKYSPGAEGKRCAHYLPNGACTREDEFMCVEWLKRNPAPSAPPTLPPPAPRPPARDLFGNPVAAPPTPELKPKAPLASMRPLPSTTTEPTVDVDQLRGFTPDDIESFKALGVEVCLESEACGEVWLVPEYTGQDRRELTPEHAATLARVLFVFPGSRVVAFHKSPKPERPERPAQERS